MEDYPANSNAAKRSKEEPEDTVEKKKVTRVVESKVTLRKKPLGKRLIETFVGGDTKGVLAYVFFDVLVPAAKDMAADAVSQGIERMLFGEIRSTNRRGPYRPGNSNSYVSYNHRYSSSSAASNPILRRREEHREDSRHLSRRARATHNFEEIVLATKPEAEMVLDRLFDLVNTYNQASVADLYDLVGVTGEFTDHDFGWRDLRGVEAVRIRNGYVLSLPRPEPLD